MLVWLYVIYVILLAEDCSVIMINGSVIHKQRQRKSILKFSSNADRGATSRCKLDAKEFINCELLND